MKMREWQQYVDAQIAEQTAFVERECRRIIDGGATPVIICSRMLPPQVVDSRDAPDWAPHDVDTRCPECLGDGHKISDPSAVCRYCAGTGLAPKEETK